MPAELKAHVWFPTLIWQADMPDDERSFIKGTKDFILKEKKETDRAARLETALRANLQRRKKQTKLRQDDNKLAEKKE